MMSALSSHDREATACTDRKALACRTFWSDHPLNLAYREVCGDRSFSLKEFVAYVMAMPADQLSRWA
jgi:hypothetical protein